MNDNELEQAIRKVQRDYTTGVVTAHDFGANYVPTELIDDTVSALTALCREYAASEIERVIGDDELIHSNRDGKHEMYNVKAIGRNELRRTLRVRADELEGK